MGPRGIRLKRYIIFWVIFGLALVGTTQATDAYELRAPSNPVVNSAHRNLNTVRAWNYVMAAADQVVNGKWTAQLDFPIQAVDTSQYL